MGEGDTHASKAEDAEHTESTETTQEGEAIRVTEEIVQEEPEERTVIREERYVNEDGKTVIRRVYKKRGKKKVRRKKKKPQKTADLDLGGGEIRTNALGGFAGIVEEDDGTPELQRFKFRKREDRDTGDKGGGEEAGAEWMNKKLRSAAHSSSDATDDTSLDDEVFNFRKLLKRRPDSPVVERRHKEERPNENFRSMLRSRGPGAGEGNEKPLKEEEEKPNFLGVLKKSSAQPSGSGERPAADAEVPEWQRVKLRARDAAGEPVKKETESTDDKEEKPLFALRKTGGKELIDEEERLAKARESELKAIERREARQKKENEEKASRDAQLKNRKLTLEEEVKELEHKKDQLTQELASLEAKIADRRKELKE